MDREGDQEIVRPFPVGSTELIAQFSPWEECLNACRAKLYAKTRREEGEVYHAWRQHPFNSHAFFVKDHRMFRYSIRVFDEYETTKGDQVLDLPLVRGGEYRVVYINGSQVICFASNRYMLGVSPLEDDSRENENFMANAQHAIGHWWYATRHHSWNAIDKAVTKMMKKSEGMKVLTFREEPAPEFVDTQDEEETPLSPVAVVLVERPSDEKFGPTKLLPYEVSEHHSDILNDDEFEEVTESVSMVLVTAAPPVPPDEILETSQPAEMETTNVSVLVGFESRVSKDSTAWSGSFVSHDTTSSSSDTEYY